MVCRDVVGSAGPYVGPMRALLAVLAAAAVLAGCSLGDEGGSDKAGGSDAPVVLSMAYGYRPQEGQPDEPALRWFAARVADLSDGAVRVRLHFNTAGDEAPEAELRVAGLVRDGTFDLGWLATRVWDQFGVKSFQALQAPFLITDYDLLGRVAESPLAGEMLSGLEPLGLSGLAVVPELLRHPVGYSKPLIALRDYEGARVRDIPSKATDALLAALGARPVHVANDVAGDEIGRGRIDGAELPTTHVYGAWTVTANVSFFGKANTVVANAKTLAKLSDDQRAVLRAAAEDTVRHVAGNPPSERAFARAFCAVGRIALASPAQLAELRRAAQPVYERLAADRRTRSLMARIRAMKRSQAGPPDPGPEACGHAGPPETTAGNARPREDFDGTYRWRLTRDGARRVGGDPDDADIGSVVTMTLDGGRWLLGSDAHYSGTFEVRGNRFVFDWPSEGYTLTIAFRRHANGSLDVKPVLPMDHGDQFVWASAPWRRVGPPVRDVP